MFGGGCIYTYQVYGDDMVDDGFFLRFLRFFLSIGIGQKSTVYVGIFAQLQCRPITWLTAFTSPEKCLLPSDTRPAPLQYSYLRLRSSSSKHYDSTHEYMHLQFTSTSIYICTTSGLSLPDCTMRMHDICTNFGQQTETVANSPQTARPLFLLWFMLHAQFATAGR